MFIIIQSLLAAIGVRANFFGWHTGAGGPGGASRTYFFGLKFHLLCTFYFVSEF